MEQAGTLAGSTGLRHNLPAQTLALTHQALFPQVAAVVQRAYIGATVDAIHWATVLMGIGLLAALLLVKRTNMHGGESGDAREVGHAPEMAASKEKARR